MSEDTRSASPPSRRPTAFNPETARRFRREAWWQVTFPVVAVSLLAVAAVVLVLAVGGPGAASVVADYSLILLAIPNLIGGLVVLAIFAGLAYLFSALIRSTPPYTFVAQDFMKRVYEWVDRQTDRIAHTVILARSALAGLQFYLKQQGFIPDTGPADEPEQSSPEAQPK